MLFTGAPQGASGIINHVTLLRWKINKGLSVDDE